MNMEEQIYNAGQEMIWNLDNPERAREAEHRFIEIITFSKADAIASALKRLLQEHFIEFPVWARNLAFRLAVFQKPTDAGLLRRAAADLRCFGPDWDAEAERMERQAEILESG